MIHNEQCYNESSLAGDYEDWEWRIIEDATDVQADNIGDGFGCGEGYGVYNGEGSGNGDMDTDVNEQTGDSDIWV